jgi:hypothetical protein
VAVPATPLGTPTLPPALTSGDHLHAASSGMSVGAGVWLLLLLAGAVAAAVFPARRRRPAAGRELSTRGREGKLAIEPTTTTAQRSPRLDLAVLLRFRIFHRGPGRSPSPLLEASVIKLQAEPDEDPPAS